MTRLALPDDVRDRLVHARPSPVTSQGVVHFGDAPMTAVVHRVAVHHELLPLRDRAVHFTVVQQDAVTPLVLPVLLLHRVSSPARRAPRRSSTCEQLEGGLKENLQAPKTPIPCPEHCCYCCYQAAEHVKNAEVPTRGAQYFGFRKSHFQSEHQGTGVEVVQAQLRE